jgi:hypothetical protein
MNLTELQNKLGQMNGAKFVGLTYTSKKHGETARYTLLVGADYRKQVEASLLECQLRAKNAQGIELEAIKALIESFEESLKAMDENREHKDYTKAGQYVTIGNGIKVNLNDMSCEIQGLQTARKVLVEGVYPKVNSKPLTIAKNKVRKELPVGRFKTLALDLGNIHDVRLNGEEIVFE